MAKERKFLRNILSGLDAKTTHLVYSSDQEKLDQADKFKNYVDDIIAKNHVNISGTTGGSTVEFLTKLMSDQKLQERNGTTSKGKNFREMMENPNVDIQALLGTEVDRFSKFDEYAMLSKHIPLLEQGINTLTDNVMSPDDFTKESFMLFHRDDQVEKNLNDDSILDRLYDLEHKYKIENISRKIIQDTFRYGDKFVAILNVDKEFNKIFNESGNFIVEDTSMLLTESDIIMNEQQEKYLRDGLKSEKYSGNIREDFAKMLNSNVTFSSNHAVLLKEEITRKSEFANKRADIDINTKPGFKGSITVNGKDVLASDGLANDSGANSDYIQGSFVKMLDPRKVVKIYTQGETYGYFYVETNEDNYREWENSTAAPFARSRAFQIRNLVDVNTNNHQGQHAQDPKQQMVYDLIVDNLAKKANKKFVKDNPQFRELIFNLLKQRAMLEKQVNFVYLEPNEVEHFHVNFDEEKGYGESVIERIAFTAKIYLATLTTQLMMKISRSADHRAFYIETGLENDVEATVQQVIRDIKAKDIKLSDLGRVDTILNTIGQFHDLTYRSFM